jgi:hypothetical protein
MTSNNLLFSQMSYTLNTLLSQIEHGSIGLPDIQRPFVWKNAKIRDLLDSMYQGFPVGYLLLWQSANAQGSQVIGVDGKQTIPSLLIVDGQQRLTSLYAVLQRKQVIREDYSHEFIDIAFNPLEEKFEVTDAAIRRDKHWIPDISVVWSKEVGLFNLFAQYSATLGGLSHEQSSRVQYSLQRLQNLMNYPFQAMVLFANVNEEQVSQVFVRINSKGQRLNETDFILTLMSVYWDEGRHQLEQFARSAKIPSTQASPYNHYLQPDPAQLLRVAIGLGFRRGRMQYVYSLLRGKDLQSGEYSEQSRNTQFTILQKAQVHTLNVQYWKDFLKCLLHAGFRSARDISSQNALLFTYILYLIGRVDYHMPNDALRAPIARWYFFASLTGRYTNSPESALESDLLQLRDVHDGTGFVSVINRNIQATLTDDYWAVTLPNELATSASRGPALSAYHAALCKLDALALFSTLKVSDLLDPNHSGTKSAVERHHLFPKKHLEKLGIREVVQTNQIANYALLEWDDNIRISDSDPQQYWPKYIQKLTSNELTQMMQWHALPDRWYAMQYDEFLNVRRGLIAQVIRDGFMKI